VQAPKPRTGKPPGGRDRRLLLLAAFSASGIVMLVGVIAFLALVGGDDGGPDNARVDEEMRAAGCTTRHVAPVLIRPDQGSFHIPSLETKATWNTTPPAGGAHFGATAVWGFYDEPVNPKFAVHNEEHGGVVLWWGSEVPRTTVDQLRAFYEEDPNAMLGTPYPSLGRRIAITAWTADPDRYGQDGYWGETHLATCPAFDRNAFETFRDTYRGRGGERIPVESNQPGGN
jgi:Protein of unknown function (DUF3105)